MQKFLEALSKPPRFVGGNRESRRHMLGMDLCNAVVTGFSPVPEVAKPVARLSVLVSRLGDQIGDRNLGGGWVFEYQSEYDEYKRSLAGVMRVVNRYGEDCHDGLVWLIAAQGWAVDCFHDAKSKGRGHIKKAWLPVIGVLAGIYRIYEYEPWADSSWRPGNDLLLAIKRASDVWR